MLALQQLVPNTNVYTLDHRGVGRSARLGCDASGAETASSSAGSSISPTEYSTCIEALRYLGTTSYLSAFTTDNAARDLASLIHSIDGMDRDNTIVYGISYGTMYTQRYLALFPDQINAAVIDGIVTQQGADGVRLSFDTYGINVDAVGQEFFRRCGQDPLCKSKLTSDPYSKVQLLLKSMFDDKGNLSHCKDFLTSIGLGEATREMFQNIFSSFLINGEDLRSILPALIYRLHRCEAKDHTFLKSLFGGGSVTTSLPCQPLSSTSLQMNIGNTELFANMYSYDELIEIEKKLAFNVGVGSSASLQVNKYHYPTYQPNPLTFNKTLEAKGVRILLMNGDLDPQTPHEYAVRTDNDLEGRVAWHKLVTFPGSAHFTVARSPVRGGGTPCGLQVLADFVRDPTKEPSLDCIADMLPVSFDGDATARALLKIENVFEDVVPAENRNNGSDSPSISKALFYSILGAIGMLVIILLISIFVRKNHASRNDSQIHRRLLNPNDV